MWLRLCISAGLALVLLSAAIWLGRGLLPVTPLPDQPSVSLELVAPLESERLAAEELRDFLAVAPARRFREAAAGAELRPLQVGAITGADPTGSDPAQVMPGTDEPPVSRERAALFERARDYARAYNLLVQRAELESRDSPNSAAAARSPERTAPSGVGATR